MAQTFQSLDMVGSNLWGDAIMTEKAIFNKSGVLTLWYIGVIIVIIGAGWGLLNAMTPIQPLSYSNWCVTSDHIEPVSNPLAPVPIIMIGVGVALMVVSWINQIPVKSTEEYCPCCGRKKS